MHRGRSLCHGVLNHLIQERQYDSHCSLRCHTVSTIWRRVIARVHVSAPSQNVVIDPSRCELSPMLSSVNVQSSYVRCCRRVAVSLPAAAPRGDGRGWPSETQTVYVLAYLVSAFTNVESRQAEPRKVAQTRPPAIASKTALIRQGQHPPCCVPNFSCLRETVGPCIVSVDFCKNKFSRAVLRRPTRVQRESSCAESCRICAHAHTGSVRARCARYSCPSIVPGRDYEIP